MRQSRPRWNGVCSIALAIGTACAAAAGNGGKDAVPSADADASPPNVAVLDEAAFPQLVEETEAARGRRFLRAPSLAWAGADDPALAALRDASRAFPLRRSAPGFFQLREVETAFADRGGDRIVVVAPAAVADVRVALGSLLDAQLYPSLVQEALALPGDPGLAQRGMLAASARATADGGLGPAPSGTRQDPFSDETLHVTHPTGAAASLATPIFAATEFLQRFDDREAPFRRPPLSTFEILVPGAWERAEPPVLLLAPAPDLPACEAVSDESVGVFRLGVALIEHGGSAPGAALGQWRGDRLVRWRCDDGAAPWVYVAELGSEGGAAALRDSADALLPRSLERPLDAAASGRRAIVSHGLSDAALRAFARALRSEPLRSALQLAPSGSPGGR